MSITFNHTIIHVLDLSLQMPVLSSDLLVLNDETESFITKHLVKTFENHDSCEACFKDNSDFLTQISDPITKESFYALSCQMAQKYYHYMSEYQNIPDGDLLITHFFSDDQPFLGILKLNYNEAFTHFLETAEDKLMTKIIKHKSIFPSSSKQIDEAIIISLSTFKIVLLDHSKGRYLSHLFDCDTALSVKETIKVVEKVAAEIIEEHYDNPAYALSELKNNISESLAKTQTIPVQDIIEQTFGEDVQVYESCIHKIEELGLKETTIEVSDSKLTNKFTSHRLKTDTGIELKLPTPLFKNPEYIEFINNPDGTLSIMLKNISQITNK
ncbi:MAG: nucleoid-associated protein [Clostridia bacterium]|jgi:hypothetical protein|nr:nucleoid-associated protein [Clostridia bacterium]